MDPRGKAGKASKALAPGARRLGSAPESDNESLPSAPSLGCPSVSPERGDSKRRVVVAEPRAILRPNDPEDGRARRTRLTPVLRSHAEVKDRKKDSEPRKPRNQGKVKSDKPAKVEQANKRRLDEEQAPRKKQKAEQKAKPEKNEKVPAEREPGPKVVEQAPKDNGNGNEKKKKKEKKEKIRKEPSDAAEPSDAEVREPSPKRVEKGKKHKEKKADKKADKANKDEKKRNKEKDKASRHPEAKDEKVAPSKRQKEKKSKQPEPEQRSKSEDPPVRQTADEPPEEASSPRRGRRRADRRARHAKEVEDTKPQVEKRAQTETRDRRRRREEREERSESRSRHKRRPQVLPPDAWQVWQAGSYHPWSSQLAGAPFGVWPMAMQSMQPMGTDGLSQAWMGNLPTVDPRRAPSPESLEVESSESEAPEESQDEEEDVEVEQPVVAEMPATEAIPQIAVLDDDGDAGDADGSVTSRTSEGEESETESQDEDAEIGEAPVARRPVIELLEELADEDIEIDMPKVQWQPPGPERLREPLHHSTERWLGPKVGWMELYQLDLDMAVQMKPSVQRIREGDGEGTVDTDGEIEGATFEANPSAPQEGVAEGPAVPLLIPRWGGTRSWSSPVQVAVEDSSCWQKRRLSSVVLRSRRTGRSAAGGGGPGANPQDPETEPCHSEGSTILIFLGAVARSVRMVQWRTPPILVLPEDLKVDPTKYRGAERAIRMKRRPTKTVAQKKAAKKSAAGPPPKAGDSVDEYEAKLKVLMQQLQDPSAAAHAVPTFWNSLSPANRVQFEKDFPQFMNMVGPGAQSKAVPPMHAHILPGQPNMMYLPVPPPPKTGAGLGVSALHAMPSLPTLAPLAPVALAPEIIKQQEAAWASRLTFHDGILRADMSALQLGDAGLARWCQWAPSLLKTLGSAGGAPLSNADLNFSGNAIEDAGLRSLLELLRSCDVHVRSLNLNVNRLTEASLVTISDLIAESRLAVSDVHMKNNRMQGSYGLMHLTRAIKDNDKYPMFLSEKQRYTPLMLHLAGNMIERPMQVTQLVKEALDNKFPPLSEERQYWESKMQCPPLQLPCFDKQETREIAMFQ